MPTRPRLATRTAVTALAVTLGAAACGVLPDAGGKGSAAPDARTVGELLAGGPVEAARRLVDAWRDGDRTLARRVASTEAVNALLGAPYPDAPPVLVSCEPDPRVPEAERCFYELDASGLILVVLPRAEGDGWEVRSAAFLDR